MMEFIFHSNFYSRTDVGSESRWVVTLLFTKRMAISTFF